MTWHEIELALESTLYLKASTVLQKYNNCCNASKKPVYSFFHLYANSHIHGTEVKFNQDIDSAVNTLSGIFLGIWVKNEILSK